MNCPCCAQPMSGDPYDGDFCWDCGIYWCDPIWECDNSDHQTSRPGSPTPPQPGRDPNQHQEG